MMPAGSNQGGGDVEEDYDRIYGKLGATWRCQNEQCKRTWGSINSWDDELQSGIRNACNACGMKGRLVGLKDKILLINIYRCSDGNGKACSSWQELHTAGENESGKESPCTICGRLVAPIGPPKEREGRVYDFECRNRACKDGNSFEWDDYFVGLLKYQKCKFCDNEGRVIGKLTKKPKMCVEPDPPKGLKPIGEASKKPGPAGTGIHDWQRCAMCISLREQGKGDTCLFIRKACCNELPEGEKIVKTEM